MQTGTQREITMATIEQRLELLERSQKLYRFATIGLLCLLVMSVSVSNGLVNPISNEVRTRKLTVVDQEDRIRAILWANPESAILETVSLNIFNGSGEKRASFFASKGELVGISFYNPHHGDNGHYPISEWIVLDGGHTEWQK
jgi:hypothetical protein